MRRRGILGGGYPAGLSPMARLVLPLLYTFFCMTAIATLAEVLAGRVALPGLDTLATGISAALLIPVHLDLQLKWYGWEERKPVRGMIPALLLSALLGGALSILYGFVTSMGPFSDFFQNLPGGQTEMFSAPIALQFLVYCLLTPALEELLFRALAFSALREMTETIRERSGSAGQERFFLPALLTALLFALYHRSPAQMLYAFPMGLVLQYVCRAGGSILFPIALHGGANLAALLVENLRA